MNRMNMFLVGLAAFALTTIVIAGPLTDRTSPAFRATVFSAAQVVGFKEGIGLLDTTNGELFELRGDLNNASAKLNWFTRVEPIEDGSGYLELQGPRFARLNAIFLVDTVTGATWIFRDRGNNNGTWEVVSR